MLELLDIVAALFFFGAMLTCFGVLAFIGLHAVYTMIKDIL